MNQSDVLNILVIDDEYEYREVLKNIFLLHGYTVETAKSGEEGLVKIESGMFNLILTDLLMDGIDGIELLEIVKSKYPEIEILIITGYGTVNNAVEAMRKGAFGYFVKSHDPEELILEVKKIEKIFRLERDNSILRIQQGSHDFLLESKNRHYREVLEIAGKVACNSSNVLILGESGVGKEVIARYINQCRQGESGSFITVNCNSFPDSLLEAELYGYEKGAFTGAVDARKGRFEAADKGILFIDEIGDLPPEIQIKLLRNLENKEISRIGSNKTISVDFKLISATNKNLSAAIQTGDFREDLFYRISTITIEVPPLRERKEDLDHLISFFIQKMELTQGNKVKNIEPELNAFFRTYSFPGNIRELRNIIERLTVLSEDGILRKKDLPGYCRGVGSHSTTKHDLNSHDREIEKLKDIQPLREFRRDVESDYIRKVLDLCGNNVSEAARRLNMSRRQLSNKINEYTIQ